MRSIGIIQARLSSSRLPGKLALDLHGKPVLVRVWERARLARSLDDVIVATSSSPSDDVTEDICRYYAIKTFRGSLLDVQSRFLSIAEVEKARIMVRVTADNPFTEPNYIDSVVALMRARPELSYAVHDLERVVHGTAVEGIEKTALEAIALAAGTAESREHVTGELRRGQNALVVTPPISLADPGLSLSIDTIEDYLFVHRIYGQFGGNADALPRIVAAYRSGSLKGVAPRPRGVGSIVAQKKSGSTP